MGSSSAQEHLRVLKVVGGFVPCSEDRVQVGKSSGHISVYMIKKKKKACATSKIDVTALSPVRPREIPVAVTSTQA